MGLINGSGRKWFGLIFILIELNLFGGAILGFAALFGILPKYNIYSNLCPKTNDTIETNYVTCDLQTAQYQLALTMGIWFYSLLPLFVGALIDYFGCRFVRLVAILFHIVGWISLSLVESGNDYLLFIHTLCISVSSISILMSGYISCSYFSHHRALVSSLMSGATISSAIWFSVFQVLITNGYATLKTLSLIWMSLELDRKEDQSHINWYQRIIGRVGVWRYLLSPMYIAVVLFLSVLLLPITFSPATWFPWVRHVTGNNENLANLYTLAFNFSTIAALVICPCSGALLGYRTDRNQVQKLFNISLVRTITWITAVALCIVRMFNTINCVIAALVLNSLECALIAAGSQAVIATFFPTKYIGILTGVMWTSATVVSSIQYGLLPLVKDASQGWRAWVIILGLIIVMSCHVIQLWYLYIKERRKPRRTSVELTVETQKTNSYDINKDVGKSSDNSVPLLFISDVSSR